MILTGLPTIVARNTMMDAKTESVVLPLVGRNVQSYDAALDASISEGADFLIYSVGGSSLPVEMVSSVSERVKIPVFIRIDSLENVKSLMNSPALVRSGASGLVVSLGELNLFRGDELNKLFDPESTPNMDVNGSQSFGMLQTLDMLNGSPGNNMVASFTKLEERKQQFVEKERAFLLEAVDVIQRAAPLVIFYC